MRAHLSIYPTNKFSTRVVSFYSGVRRAQSTEHTMGKLSKFEKFIKHEIANTDFDELYKKKKARDASPPPVKAEKKVVKKKKVKREKKPKDPNAPTKANGVFFLWSNSPGVKAAMTKSLGEKPDITAVRAWKSAQWHALTDEQREPWYRMNAEEKERYARQQAEYEKTGTFTKAGPVPPPVAPKAKVEAPKAKAEAPSSSDSDSSDDSSSS